MLCYNHYTGPGLAHKGRVLPNHSLLTRDPAVIGEDDDAVYCVTDDATCCGTPSAGNGRGNWYFPNGNVFRYNKPMVCHMDHWGCAHELQRHYYGMVVQDSSAVTFKTVRQCAPVSILVFMLMVKVSLYSP